MPEKSDDPSMIEQLNGRLLKLSYRRVRLYLDDLGRIWTHDRNEGHACVGTLKDAEQYVQHLEHEDLTIAVMA